MNESQQSIPVNMEKFHNAEQMWFWFVYSKSVQSNLIRNHRPLCDVYVNYWMWKR